MEGDQACCSQGNVSCSGAAGEASFFRHYGAFPQLRWQGALLSSRRRRQRQRGMDGVHEGQERPHRAQHRSYMYIANRATIDRHGGCQIGRFDNRKEFTNAEFWELLVELGVKPGYTPPGGAKRNGRVEKEVDVDCGRCEGSVGGVPSAIPGLGVPC